jgi:hypothetical protein
LTGSWPVATLKRRVAQKCFLKSYRAVKSALIEPDLISRLRWAWNTGVVPGYVPRGRKAEDGRIDDRYNLIELSTSSYPARTKRNIEESDDTVIFSLERLLSGRDQADSGTCQQAWEAGAAHLQHPERTISEPDLICLEIQILSDFLVLKQDRNPERGWPSGIEGAWRLRLDADDVAVSEAGGLWNGIHRNSRRVGRWGISLRTYR